MAPQKEHSPVSSSPQVLRGTLVFRGTRVPVQSFLDYQNDGFSLDQFLEFFPSVQKEDLVVFQTLLEQGEFQGSGQKIATVL